MNPMSFIEQDHEKQKESETSDQDSSGFKTSSDKFLD